MRRSFVKHQRFNRHELNRDGTVYSYRDQERGIPFRASPRDAIGRLSVNRYFSRSPLRLSDGLWSVYSLMNITSDNKIHIIGSGYHSVLRCGTGNDIGILNVSGAEVTIEGVRFVRDSTSATADVGVLLNLRGNRATIRNCWFDAGNAQTAFSGTLADKVTIESCIFEGGAGDIIYLKDSDDAMVKNNRFVPSAGRTQNVINLDSTDVAVAAERCNDCVVVGNHVGGVYDIRYNVSGAHAVVGNNTSANLVAYV